MFALGVANPSAAGREIRKICRVADLFHSFQRHARAKTSADQRAHTGAGDAVDGDSRVAKRAQHADVRDSTRESASQRQANLGPSRRTLPIA